MVGFAALLSIATLIGLVHTIPPPQCMANFRWDDCGQPPQPVIYYWRTGSRCEVGIWRGCLPNINMFKDEYECVSTCTFAVRASAQNYHEIKKDDSFPNDVTFEPSDYDTDEENDEDQTTEESDEDHTTEETDNDNTTEGTGDETTAANTTEASTTEVTTTTENITTLENTTTDDNITTTENITTPDNTTTNDNSTTNDDNSTTALPPS